MEPIIANTRICCARNLGLTLEKPARHPEGVHYQDPKAVDNSETKGVVKKRQDRK